MTAVVMAGVVGPSAKHSTPTVSAALCVAPSTFDRYRGVLRHLLVGLVDQTIGVRLLSSDTRIESLTLGPVQTTLYQRMVWPFTRRRTHQLLNVLSHHPPTLVHAFSCESYRIAGAIARAFDADLVFQVTSLADCEAIGQLGGAATLREVGGPDHGTPHTRKGNEVTGVGRFLALSEPLVATLTDQLTIPSDRVELVRPGVLASTSIACFSDPKRIPTLLCPLSFDMDCGVDWLIEAVGLLLRRDYNLMLFLLGQGPHETAVRRLIRNEGLSRWVTVACPLGDLTQTMRSADIFIRPSSDNSLTTEILQAMGAGLAVVAFPSSVCDFLRAGETAVVCDVNSKPGQAKRTTTKKANTVEGEMLAGAIERLLNDRAAARRIAAAGMEYVRTHHSMSRMAQCTAEAYQQLALARATFSLTE